MSLPPGCYSADQVDSILRFLEDNLSTAESCMEDLDGVTTIANQPLLAGQYERWRSLARGCSLLLPIARNLARHN